MTDRPNPGSDEAIALGCTCPVLDNGHGRGSGPFWITVDCPLHGEPAIAKAIYTNRSELYADNLLPHSEDDA